MLLAQKDLDLPETGELSSTNSANPLVCSVGLATINVMNSSKFLKTLQRNCRLFDKRLSEIQLKYSGRVKVFGEGMIKAIIFYDNKGAPDIDSTNKIVDELLTRRLLVVKTGRESIKLGPPLNIKKEI